MLQSYSARGQKGFVKGNYITFLSILTPPLSICILPSSSECWDKDPDPVDKLCSYMIFFFLAIHERKREKLMKAKAALVPWRAMTIMKTSYSKRRPCFHVLTGRTKRIYFTVFWYTFKKLPRMRPIEGGMLSWLENCSRTPSLLGLWM